MKKKRFAAALAAFGFVLAALPFSAFATGASPTEYDIWLGSTQFTSAQMSQAAYGGSAVLTENGGALTLTLSGVNVNGRTASTTARRCMRGAT